MVVKKNLSFIFKNFKLNLAKELQYKSSFITQVVMMILNDLFFILQWTIIFSLTSTMGGYGLREVMLLWALSAGSYGIAHTFFEGAFYLGDMVYNGALDVFMTQPKNILISASCSKSSMSAIGDIIYTFIALAIAGAPLWWYIAIIPVCIVGGIIYTSIIICFQTLSFYIKRGSAIADMISSAVTYFSNYPPIIFDIFSKIILYTIVPCGFMIFAPAEYIFLGFNIWWILGIIGFAIIITILAFKLFNHGLKRYSSGSIVNNRV